MEWTRGNKTDRTLKMRIPPSARFSGEVRKSVVAFADGTKFGQRNVEEFIFAVGEALANAIEHAHTSNVIEISCRAG